jgi:acyl-coenzyme A synthetase/AMP-(fatty) acid ligase
MDLLAGNRAGRVGFLTSGTTGTPRVVHHGLPTLSRGVRRGPELEAAIWGNGYHPAHMAGVQVLLQAMGTGCPCVQLHGLEPPEILRRIREAGISHLSATPGLFRFLLPVLEVEKPLTGIRRLTLGGEAFDPPLAARLKAVFPGARVGNIYASTEAGSLFVAEGDCFRISPRLEGQVKVVDGELWLAAPLLGELEIAGPWYATGDQVAVVGDYPLRIRFVGRTRTRLKVSGYPVHPEAVEAALIRHPAIAEARVHGRPHSLVGHLLEADCVPEKGASLPDEAELRRFLARTCQPHEIPRIFRFVERIEKTTSGKARR